MHMAMKKRWAYYLLAGELFGIFDFYFQTWINRVLPAATTSMIAMLVPILGVWLLLVAPIAWYEARASRSARWAAAASAFTWSAAVVVYYLFNGVKLIFIGEASRPEMHISNRASDPYYWSNVQSFFTGDFVSGVREWLVVALVGGTLVGLVVGWLALRGRQASTARG